MWLLEMISGEHAGTRSSTCTELQPVVRRIISDKISDASLALAFPPSLGSEYLALRSQNDQEQAHNLKERLINFSNTRDAAFRLDFTDFAI